MSYQIVFDTGTAYELLDSFYVYVNRSRLKVTDLGPNWANEVELRLSPEFAEMLNGFKDKFCTEWLLLLVWKGPSSKTASAFLDWFEEQSPGQLYEMISPYMLPNHSHIMNDLGAWRDECLYLLRGWHEQYFRNVQPDVLEQLAEEARAKSSDVCDLSAVERVEQISGGVFIEPSPDLQHVVLIPAFHASPLNVYAKHKSVILILYPMLTSESQASDPPNHLSRSLRALADDTRMRILKFLSGEPQRFIDVVQHVGLSKSVVHNHLILLRAAGLIRVHISYENTERYSLRLDALTSLHSQLESYMGATF